MHVCIWETSVAITAIKFEIDLEMYTRVKVSKDLRCVWNFKKQDCETIQRESFRTISRLQSNAHRGSNKGVTLSEFRAQDHLPPVPSVTS